LRLIMHLASIAKVPEILTLWDSHTMFAMSSENYRENCKHTQ
jgi:hypothetical protein